MHCVEPAHVLLVQHGAPAAPHATQCPTMSSANPVLQARAQRPPMHDVVPFAGAMHAAPHAPQFATESSVVQPVAQRCCPAGQPAESTAGASMPASCGTAPSGDDMAGIVSTGMHVASGPQVSPCSSQ